MERINFYDVDPEYLSYMQNIDSKVPNHNYDTHDKIYCGVVLKMNNCNYLAPLSHFNRSQATNFIIRDYHNRDISSLRFCFMIPVLDNVIHITDLDSVDNAYAGLLHTELAYCRQNIDKIYRGAHRTYSYGTNPNHRLYRNCCDFHKLEEEYRKFHV